MNDDNTNVCTIRMHVRSSEITATRYGHYFLTACYVTNVIDRVHCSFIIV